MRVIPLVAVVLALAAAAPALAQPDWILGSTEESTVADCAGQPEPGVFADAELLADPDRAPAVGEVFYVRTLPARVGDGCGQAMTVHVEVVPPAGVRPAISAATPVRCRLLDIDLGAETPAAGCPQTAQDGTYGLAFDRLAPRPTPWVLATGQALVVEVPLRSSRPLAGLDPGCEREEGDPPCAAGAAGDALQFADRISDRGSSPWLAPFVTLVVDPAATTPAPTAGGAPPLIARAPRSVRAAHVVRGFRVAVNAPAAGARITVALGRPGASYAWRTVTASGSGRLRLTLRASPTGARRLLRRHDALHTPLRVRAVSAGGAVASASAPITVTPRRRP